MGKSQEKGQKVIVELKVRRKVKKSISQKGTEDEKSKSHSKVKKKK